MGDLYTEGRSTQLCLMFCLEETLENRRCLGKRGEAAAASPQWICFYSTSPNNHSSFSTIRPKHHSRWLTQSHPPAKIPPNHSKTTSPAQTVQSPTQTGKPTPPSPSPSLQPHPHYH